MPLEIRELHIKVTVNEQGMEPARTPGNAPAGGANGDERNALINQCIEQILEILNNKKER